jgi:dihydroflavonol-4-reductase
MTVHTVFVSGATGFIASHTIAQLLAAGHRVRGSVRSLKKPADSAALVGELPGAADRLELVEANLLAPRAFDDLVMGCDIVLHIASPYTLDVGDPQRDLVDPAVQGTRSMLEACAKAASVRRVVLTSSMAAITDEPDPDTVLTEANWNEKSTLTRNPYYLSKTLAEREAWAFVTREKPSWDLVAINPFLVTGPSLTRALNTSNKVLADILNGVYPGILGLAWGMVDVRDVADAHVRAMDAETAHGRYLCAAGTITMREIVDVLKASGYAGYRLPRLPLDNRIGNAIVKLASFGQSRGVRQYLRTHVGRVPRFDNSKIQRDLGLRFRPIQQTVLETAADLIRWGHVAHPADSDGR